MTTASLARLKEAGHALGSDYRVRVRMYTADRPDAVIIPRSALFRGPGGAWQVFVNRNGHAELTSVTLGLTNDEHVAIEEGIEPGAQVILAPPAFARRRGKKSNRTRWSQAKCRSSGSAIAHGLSLGSGSAGRRHPACCHTENDARCVASG